LRGWYSSGGNDPAPGLDRAASRRRNSDSYGEMPVYVLIFFSSVFSLFFSLFSLFEHHCDGALRMVWWGVP
jgi:hypothetical protein